MLRFESHDHGTDCVYTYTQPSLLKHHQNHLVLATFSVSDDKRALWAPKTTDLIKCVLKILKIPPKMPQITGLALDDILTNTTQHPALLLTRPCTSCVVVTRACLLHAGGLCPRDQRLE